MFDNLKHNGLYRITYVSNDITFRDIEAKFDNRGKFFYLGDDKLRQIGLDSVLSVDEVVLESKPYLPKGKKFQQWTKDCIAGKFRLHKGTSYFKKGS